MFFQFQIPVNVAGLPTLPLIPAAITAESICEQAARLLFLNVHWARDLAVGTNLVIEDQLTLLESSWRELFLLAAAQILPTLDPTPLLPPGPQGLGLAVEVTRFRETLAGFHAMSLDQHELLLLPSLRSVSAHAIEELFFRRTIGIIPIERIICDMYKAA